MDYFTGQIVPFAIGYAPKQTALCQGQMLPVNQNQALFSLLGVAYGGNGTTNFGLPNAAGRMCVGYNTGGLALGAVGGEASHTLTTGEIPSHGHALNAITGGSSGDSAIDAMPATSNSATYGAAANLVGLGGGPLANGGGGQPHPNMQPSTAINFAIVLYGVFPTRS